MTFDGQKLKYTPSGGSFSAPSKQIVYQNANMALIDKGISNSVGTNCSLPGNYINAGYVYPSQFGRPDEACPPAMNSAPCKTSDSKRCSQNVVPCIPICNGQPIVKKFVPNDTSPGICPPDWGAHAAETMEFLRAMWKDSKMCDVVLKVYGVSFPAHKVALAAHSDKYAHCFNSLQNGSVSEIVLENTSPDAVKNVLSYVYTGIIEINDNIVDAVLGCARELGISKIEHLCKDYILTVSVNKAFFYLDISERHDLIDASVAIRRFIKSHFKEISNTQNFVFVDFDGLCRLLSDDTLVVGSELDVFFAILRWIDFDRDTRICHAADLIRLVRFNHVSPEEIVTHVEPIQYIFQIPACKDVLYAALRFHALKGSGSTLVNCNAETLARQGYMTPLYQNYPQYQDETSNKFMPMYLDPTEVSCHQTSNEIHCQNSSVPKTVPPPIRIENYSPPLKILKEDPDCQDEGFPRTPLARTSTPIQFCHEIQEIPACLDLCSVKALQSLSSIVTSPVYHTVQQPVLLETRTSSPICNKSSPPLYNLTGVSSKIMTVGGVSLEKSACASTSRTVHEYNPQTNNWYSVSQIPDNRHHHGAAAIDNDIYIIGGSLMNQEECAEIKVPTNICYKFNIINCCWSRICDMRYRRVYHSVAEVFGLVYAVGGEDQFGQILDSVECYNPMDDTWHVVKRMKEGKIGTAAIGHKGQLLVMGGFSSRAGVKRVLDTVESYDLQSDRWKKKKKLPIPLCHANAVEVKGNVFLIGGATFSEGTSSIISVRNVFKYKEASDTWNSFQMMMVARHDASVTCIGNIIYILGGMSSVTGSVLTSVECLDTSSKSWVKGIEDLPYPILGSAACTVIGKSKARR